jgi:Zn-dependent protease
MTLTDIIILLAIFMLFFFGLRLLQFVTFLYYRFKNPHFKTVSKESVDEDILKIIKPLEDFLTTKGFSYVAMLEHDGHIVGATYNYHIAYYYNTINGVHAFIETHPYKGALQAATISFKSFYEDGRCVETVNGIKHFAPNTPKYIALYDHYLTENEDIYNAHLSDREKEQSTLLKESFTQENIVLHKNQDHQEYIESWEDIGVIKINEDGYKFTFSWATYKFAMQSTKGQQNYAKILRKREVASQDGEVTALISQLDTMEKSQGKSNKKLWFGVSLIAFAVLFGLLGLTLVDIGILIVVLLVHELGHYLAMRYYGYTDTSIFFLPFGAAAVGKKEYRKAYEEYIVFLAGPLPGILIGTVILVWSIWQQYNGIFQESHLMMYAMMSLVINYINLLPIYPLDGGRILQLLLLHRYPKGQFYFYLVSLVVLVVAMIWLQDVVLLILTIIVALGVKQSYRVSQFMSKLFSKYEPNDIDKTIVAQEMMEDENYNKETLQTKANIAKQILHIVQTSKPSRWLIGFGMAFYMFLLMPPFVVTYMPYLMTPHSEYDKLPIEAQKKLDTFYKKVSSLEGLTQKAKETYTIEDSMAILQKYLYDRDVNRTVGKALVITEEINLTDVPKELKKLYAWHDGITSLLPDGDFFSFKQMNANYKDYLEEIRAYEDENYTTAYRVFVGTYGYSGLAYNINKEGIYDYTAYTTEKKKLKYYYSFNHFLKITAEAYKLGAYCYDYDKLEVDEAKLAKLKRTYLSQKDKERYETFISYLQESAVAFQDLPYEYIKKEILRTMSRTHDTRMIPFIKLYLSDKNKKVRQNAVYYLGKLGDRSTIPLLIKQLKGDPMHCKGCALSGLSHLVDSRDVALLDKIYPMTNDTKMHIRINAYKVIGRIANSSSISLLKEHFDKENSACKLAIIEAFGRIGDKEVLPLLKTYLKEIEKMDFSVSYERKRRNQDPRHRTLQREVKKAIQVLEKI